MLKLRPHQNIIKQWILDHPRCAIWASMGAGKTSAVLESLFHLNWASNRPTLIIAPLRVAKQVWVEEAKRWQFKDIVPIIGTPAQRVRALNKKASTFSINFENIPWLVEHLGSKQPFSTIVVDESTRLKHFRIHGKGRNARALAKLTWNNVDRFIQLTGTPAPNGVEDLWGQIWFLDKGERLGSSFRQFTNRWFYSRRASEQGGEIYTPRAGATEEIEETLKDICLSVDIKDHMDLNDPIVKTAYVDLPKKALLEYNKLKREMVLKLEESTVLAVNAAVLSNKCLQVANGAIYDEDKKWFPVHDEKLKALSDIIEEAGGKPVLVAYQYESDKERILKHFPKSCALNTKSETIEQWNAGKIPILLVHPASAGHGLNLQYGGNILVFFSLWWDLEQHLQIIERIGPARQAQAGFKRPVYIYYIIANKTIDEYVFKRLREKRSIQDILLEAMKKEN